MERIKQHKNIIWIGAAIVALIIAGSFIPYFYTLDNLLNVVRQSSVVAICAVGVTMVIIILGIDLSVGGIVSFGAMVCGILMLAGNNIVLCMLAGMAVGLAFGLFNGFMVAKIGVPPFITTLVVGQVAAGLALVLSNGGSIGGFPDSYGFIGNGTFLGVPVSNYIMAAFVIVGSLFMAKTKMGSQIYALGGNETVVRQEGINTNKIKIIVYGISGFCAACGGILLSAQLDTVHPIQGEPYLLDTIAACVIGGVSMMGGEGKIYLALVGALVIGLVRNALNMLGMHPFYQNIIIGAIIIVVVAISVWNKNKKIKESKTF
ncbi:ABC transporter permease [Christensenella intestinihominis]|uniref:ABC transporter permease n=1 Tax=Christensenella intestinihominis TaxID=1851429 RepID=UPI000830C219|nr:ABC transporter permease [Christensenella intestinihominis]